MYIKQVLEMNEQDSDSSDSDDAHSNEDSEDGSSDDESGEHEEVEEEEEKQASQHFSSQAICEQPVANDKDESKQSDKAPIDDIVEFNSEEQAEIEAFKASLLKKRAATNPKARRVFEFTRAPDKASK